MVAEPSLLSVDLEGVTGPPRMSQEINPMNLEDLFATDPDCNVDPACTTKQVEDTHRQIFAGSRAEDEFEMRKLQVFVRIRPTVTEGAPKWDSDENCIHASSKHALAIAPPEGSIAYRSGDRGQTFSFSQVFDASTTQDQYYGATAGPLVSDLLRNPGHSSVMMAYGITAAGKTYTIEGTKSSPGVLPRALKAIFEGLEHHVDTAMLSLRVSLCEIYNEAIYDLLEEPPGAWPRQRPALRLMEDATGRVTVSGLSEVVVSSTDDALAVLRRGAKHRQRAETGLNYSSSRSHSIFTISLIRTNAVQGAVEDGAAPIPAKHERLGRMAFVDLAGSERAQRTGNVGIRLKESVAINSSLMTLGRCLEALRWNQQQQAVARAGGAPGPLRVVPYRESKVTHLFRDPLHGFGTVVLSVNVSPCARDYDETAHVLRYACMATHIGTLAASEAPRRTIKAITPGALRRVRRKAAKAGDDDKKRGGKKRTDARVGKNGKQYEGPPEQHVASQQQHLDSPEPCHSPSEAQIQEPMSQGFRQVQEGEDGWADCDIDRKQQPVQSHHANEIAQDAWCLPENDTEGQEVQGAQGEEATEYLDEGGTPSTPLSAAHSEDYAVGAAAYGALQAQVQQLIKDLQAAEERAVLVEGEVREEVAAEMVGLLKDMEESYQERLAVEVAAVEARVRAAHKNGRRMKKSDKKRKDKSKGKHPSIATDDMADAPQSEDSAVERGFEEEFQQLKELLARQDAEIEALRGEVELQRAEARVQADQLAAARSEATASLDAAEQAQRELSMERERAETLAASLAESRRRSEEVVARRVMEELIQKEANAAMELGMAEQQIDRLRKDNETLRQRLAATMATLESVASPSMPMLQRLAAACPTGNGCGAAGTPHEVALARARRAAAMEDAAATATIAGESPSMAVNLTGHGFLSGGLAPLSLLGGQQQPRQRSRFADEALAAGGSQQGTGRKLALGNSQSDGIGSQKINSDDDHVEDDRKVLDYVQQEEPRATEEICVLEGIDDQPSTLSADVDGRLAESHDAGSEPTKPEEEAELHVVMDVVPNDLVQESVNPEEKVPSKGKHLLEIKAGAEKKKRGKRQSQRSIVRSKDADAKPKRRMGLPRALRKGATVQAAVGGASQSMAPNVTGDGCFSEHNPVARDSSQGEEPVWMESIKELPLAEEIDQKNVISEAEPSSATVEEVEPEYTVDAGASGEQMEDKITGDLEASYKRSPEVGEATQAEAPGRNKGYSEQPEDGGAAVQNEPPQTGQMEANPATGAENRRKRRLLQPAKPMSSQMRLALGEVAGGELGHHQQTLLPGCGPTPSKDKGISMAVALGLSPAPSRARSPRRTRRKF